MKHYKAPDRKIDYNLPSIFLAGSIEMGVAENWQDKLAKALEYESVILFNPRRDDWDSAWKQSITNPNFVEQVNWELDMLDVADWIVMYFDPKTMSPISLLELGLYAKSGKLIVCCPDGFWRKGNVEVVCHRYQVPVYNDIDSFIEKILALVA